MIAPIRIWPTEEADLKWASRTADMFSHKMGMNPCWEFRQAAMIRMWEVHMKTRLSGSTLRKRSYHRIRFSIVDEIRRTLGRPGQRRSRAYAELWRQDEIIERIPSRASVPTEKEVSSREIVDRILARCTPRQRVIVEMTLRGHTLREIGLACGRVESWTRLQLNDLREVVADLC